MSNMKEEIEKELIAAKDMELVVYDDPVWHTTIWNMKNNKYKDNDKFEDARNHLENPQLMKFILDRVSLIKNGIILREYDLVNNQVLSRTEALDNNIRYHDYMKLKKKLEDKGENFEREKKTNGFVVYIKHLFGIKDEEKIDREPDDGTVQSERN